MAVVTFDSSPKLIQTFTPDLGEAAATLRDLSVGCSRQNHFPNCSGPKPVHDKPMGDNGAAILDSLVFAVDMLRSESAGHRRTILLVSEMVDRGSVTTMEQAVRAITDTNTAIYAIGFSTAKSEAAHYAHHQLPLNSGGWRLSEDPRFDPTHGCVGKRQNPVPDDPSGKWSQFYNCAATIAAGALFELNRAIAMNPREVQALSLRGNLRLQRRDLKGAVQDLESAHSIDPASASAAYNLARAYFALGREEEANVLSKQLASSGTDAVNELSNQKLKSALGLHAHQ